MGRVAETVKPNERVLVFLLGDELDVVVSLVRLHDIAALISSLNVTVVYHV